MAEVALVTGITGYIGERVAARLLERGVRVLALVRDGDDEGPSFDERTAALARYLGNSGVLSFIRGDLRRDDALDGVNAGEVDYIVHAAAVTRFNVEEALANTINLAGSRRVFDFATRCPELRCLSYISTIYACGLVEGEVLEEPHTALRPFSNHYERTKYEAEALLREGYSQLPWRVLRVATIIADNNDGRVIQQNAFHNSLKLFFYGLLSLIPGQAQTPLYFVTGDFVADAIVALTLRSREHAVYHISHSRSETLTLEGLLDIAYERFGKEEDFRARNILRPLLCDEQSFALLAGEADAFGASVMGQGMASVTPFAPQLFLDKNVENTRLREDIENYCAPDPRDLLSKTCDHLVATRWGKRAG